MSRIEGTSLVCPCHGSAFALDGSVTHGPAQKGLSAQPVAVRAGQITVVTAQPVAVTAGQITVV